QQARRNRRRRLQEARMPSGWNDLELGAAEGSGERAAVAWGREDVVLADQHERRRAQERQEPEQIVCEARVDLSLEGIGGRQAAGGEPRLLRDQRRWRIVEVAMREGPRQH